MKLQIESIDITGVRSGSKTSISDHVLNIDFKELEQIILQDTRIKSVELNVAYPGDRVRIINVVDVIQSRCKIDRDNEDFPGRLGKLVSAGQGRTRSLRGLCVVLSNSKTSRIQLPLIDMFGIGSERGKYGKMINISIHPIPEEDTDERDFDNAVKEAGLKTAVYLARSADSHSIDETKTYELDIPKHTTSDLPKIAYYYQLHTPQHDHSGIADPILYGTEVTNLLPTLIHPNEVLDGAVININSLRFMTDTYSMQNHAVIKELYNRHEKELIFAGMVIGVATMESVQRQRMAIMAANLISNILGADGVILTKVHGGMPHVDLALTAEACEDLGVKTTLFIHLIQSQSSITDQLLFSSESLDAVINVGNVIERMYLPHADRILGGTVETPVFHPDIKQKAGDECVVIEGSLAGVYNHIGDARIVGVEY